MAAAEAEPQKRLGRGRARILSSSYNLETVSKWFIKILPTPSMTRLFHLKKLASSKEPRPETTSSPWSFLDLHHPLKPRAQLCQRLAQSQRLAQPHEAQWPRKLCRRLHPQRAYAAHNIYTLICAHIHFLSTCSFLQVQSLKQQTPST